MKGKSTGTKSVPDRFILIAIGLAAFYWLLESAADVLVFHKGSFSVEVLSPAPHEIWMRSTVVIILILFGLYGRLVRRRQEKSEERISRFNLVLRAVRNVNQLITREKSRARLIQRCCDELVKTRGYYTAWSALMDESGRSYQTAESGLGDEFMPVSELLERGETINCGLRATKQPGVVVIEDPSSSCPGCSLMANYAGRAAMSVRLEHDEKIYGLLTVSIPRDLANEEVERVMLGEAARDIAFALHDIEVEEGRDRAQKEVKEQRDRAERYLDIAGVIIVAINSRGEVTLMNRKGCEVLGYKKGEIIGRDWFDIFIPAGVRDGVKGVFRRLMAGEIEPVEYFENSVLTRNGEERLFSWYNTVLRDDPGNIMGTLSSGEDITDRKSAEYELLEHQQHLEKLVEERTNDLRRTHDELINHEKLAALGQVAGGVAHELRNPLGAIKNVAYFLNMALENPEPDIKECLKIMDNEVVTSENIIDALFDFSRKRPPARQKVDVNRLVEETLDRVPVPETVEIVTELDKGIPGISGDPVQLGQVFGNIIRNALQAMPEGGRLLIKSGIQKSGWITISLADTGTGIPEEDIENVFKPLFTTKAKGIGLGLAITKAHVEGHGGTIGVQSEPRNGTTFTVGLPIS